MSLTGLPFWRTPSRTPPGARRAWRGGTPYRYAWRHSTCLLPEEHKTTQHPSDLGYDNITSPWRKVSVESSFFLVRLRLPCSSWQPARVSGLGAGSLQPSGSLSVQSRTWLGRPGSQTRSLDRSPRPPAARWPSPCCGRTWNTVHTHTRRPKRKTCELQVPGKRRELMILLKA